MKTLYKLPAALRAELKPPMAPVLSTADAVRAIGDRVLIAVGDVCTEHFLEAGLTPALIVADWFTQRGAVAAEGATGSGLRHLRALHADARAGTRGRLEQVDNPAATITEALWSALESGLHGPAPVIVEVAGEEDLAVLPALVLAPDDACVAYGQPNEGVVVVDVNDATRARARDLLHRMRVDDADPSLSSPEV